MQKAVYGVLGDPTKTRDVTAKVQAIVDGGERRFAAWRLGEGDDPGMQLLKSLSIDYTLDGIPASRWLWTAKSSVSTIRPTRNRRPRSIRRTTATCCSKPGRTDPTKLKTASGRTLRCQVDDLPAALQIEWPVGCELSGPDRRAGERHARPTDFLERSSPILVSSTSPEQPPTETTFRVPPEVLAAGRAAYLDFGKVAVIAQVRLNGKDLGILWKTPFRVEATPGLRAGENLLEVQVTNLWVNRMIGDEQLPEDSERTPEGLLKSWPAWLLEGKPSPVGRHTSPHIVFGRGLPFAGVGASGSREVVHDATGRRQVGSTCLQARSPNVWFARRKQSQGGGRHATDLEWRGERAIY